MVANSAVAQLPEVVQPPVTVAPPRTAPLKRDEPPGIDELYDSKGQSEAAKQALHDGQASFQLNPCAGEKPCADPLGHAGQRLYLKLRNCWQPKPGTAVATAFWFGEETAAERHAAPAPGDVSVRFQMTRDGHLAGSPWSTALATPDAVSAEVIEALRRCQPYEMPSDRFEIWKDALLRIQTRAPGDKTAFHKF